MALFAAVPCKYSGTYYILGGEPCDCRTLPPVIIGEGNTLDQVRYAVRCVCGENRKILDVEHADVTLPTPFPVGTRLFYVTSMCGHVDKVYWCADRSGVVEFSQLQMTMLDKVIQQLRGS